MLKTSDDTNPRTRSDDVDGFSTETADGRVAASDRNRRTEELLDRVRALLPGIRSRAEQAEDLRRLPDATIQDLTEAGVFAMHAPAEFGGLELEIDALFELALLLGTACTSTAWTATFLAYHNAALGRFPAETQQEVFADRGFALSAGSFHPLPGSRGELVDGGIRVTGRWDFCSGVMHSDWCFVDVPVEATGDQPATRFVCLIPVSELEVVDVWHTTGMRGTGSNDVKAEGVFVPAHHALHTPDFHGTETPGALHRPGHSLLRMPIYRAAGIFHPAFAIGSAERALEVFRTEIAGRRQRPVNGGPLVQAPLTHSRYAKAVTLLHSATLMARAQSDEAGAHYAGHAGNPDLPARAIMRLSSVSAITQAAEAVELVTRVSGGSMFRRGSELDRIKRDMAVLLNHNSGDADFHTETAGKVLLGLEPTGAEAGAYRAL
ncbi:acyl-CoA dehydrogenase family protein [Streptomyces blattellae]|uniref:acyl-CoA dehydrogenase family protein n=1 Tax=Streptomyces blattellae TaxID=2569855 RepID=UPI0012B9331F|nr:acyl-CoA dehydrogenase family protein [Streptomyces blattellae]